MSYNTYGQGEPLIYLPGLDGTGELFYRQIEDLTRAFSVVTYGLRTEGDFTYQDLTADICALIKTQNYDQVTLCGESFGGTLALQFALSHPKLVKQLIIINSFPYFRNRALLGFARVLFEFTPYEIVQASRRLMGYVGLLAEDLSPTDQVKFFELTHTLPKLALSRRLTLVRDFDVRNRLAQIDIPTLFIASRKDQLQNSVLEAEFMASQMSNAQIRALDNMGHLPLLSEKFNLYELLVEALSLSR